MQVLSFFERLPYDVRIIIYRYLEPGDLPPLTRGFQSSTSGFILSCRCAKQDMEDIAATQLIRYLANFKTTFEKSTNLVIHISGRPSTNTLAQLRHITVALPFTAFQTLLPSARNAVWEREVLAGLHPLFAQFFDKVHIHICGTDNKPAHETLLDRGRVEVGVHSLLRDITYMIERVNRDETAGQNGVSIDTIFKYEMGERKTYPTERVNAKRICLSWDLRSDSLYPRPTGTLNGKRHRERAENIGEFAVPFFFYQLRDEQRMVGEMGITSETRWISSPREPAEFTPTRLSFSALLNAHQTPWEYCSIQGLGEEVKEGLVGVEGKEFEEYEALMSELVWA